MSQKDWRVCGRSLEGAGRGALSGLGRMGQWEESQETGKEPGDEPRMGGEGRGGKGGLLPLGALLAVTVGMIRVAGSSAFWDAGRLLPLVLCCYW